jgi:hypothetical protein
MLWRLKGSFRLVERITDAQELESIWEDDNLLYETIETRNAGRSRWANNMVTVFKRLSDGKLFLMHWRQGATEYQEHDMPTEAVEAEAYEVSVTKYRVKS